MLRKFHALSGLTAALLVILLSVTGAILSINPFLERTQATVSGTSTISVAVLAGTIKTRYPGVEQIDRTPSGSIIVYFSEGDHRGAHLIDPVTGATIGDFSPSPVFMWVKKFHRSLLLDIPGRVASASGALLIILLTLSGAILLARRSGGWSKILQPVQGSLAQRFHAQLSRFAMLGLTISAGSGLYLSAITLELIPEPQQVDPVFPAAVSSGQPAPIDTLLALKAIQIVDLRELVFPYPGDPTDVFSIRTQQGEGFIDQSTGELLSFESHATQTRIHEFIYSLHTGEGLWWMGILLGITSITVPLITLTGTQIWWRRKQSSTTIVNNIGPDLADTVILVGSEGSSTSGFAKTLHHALDSLGHRVHTAPMNALAANYRSAKRMFILTSTYADGTAPASATQFLNRLAYISEAPVPYAVLGFGDRQFPHFCQYAKQVSEALRTKGWPELQSPEFVDRQSSQTFSRWGEDIGKNIGIPLTLSHTAQRPRTTSLQLSERIDYGAELNTPTSVLRFTSADSTKWTDRIGRLFLKSTLPSFEAGDLVGILPPGSDTPRFYSLASLSAEGVLEICVRHHEKGLCSGFLHELSIGRTIEVFIQCNPQFRPAVSGRPVILVGAGTGIGPLAGFIRNNEAHHPMYLYWGGRNPQSDFLYADELKTYPGDHRLSGFNPAFSRLSEGSAYVQDKLAADAPQVRHLIEAGGQILVCGGRDMAARVMETIDEILAPLHLDVSALKIAGRYREDVY